MTTANFGVALRLQCADLEYVRVVPALTEGGVREDKPYRLVQTKQTLFVFHDQIISISIIRGLGFPVNFTLYKPCLFALLLVNGEIALVGFVNINVIQIFEVCLVANLTLERTHHAGIFLLKHFGILTVAAIIVVAVVQAVFCHLVDEK